MMRTLFLVTVSLRSQLSSKQIETPPRHVDVVTCHLTVNGRKSEADAWQSEKMICLSDQFIDLIPGKFTM
jgi:hypothetical protein